ncbi:MAG: (d)CMP kinase [Alphaproteobacteria bacterium]|nr:(d)CMP kinase [Alphaproteobacteria bacterium]
MIIAIDGTSAAGKGTLAKRLQDFFGFAYLDTGALYRAVGKKVLDSQNNPENATIATQIAQSLSPETMLCLQNDPSIRTEVCGAAASKVSAIPSVRQALFDFQRNFALNPVFEDGTPAKGAILDGRDIGTVVCPDAEIKLFLIASAEIRAKRRLKELQEKGIYAIYEDVLADVKKRDERDSNRAVAPLKPADDAFILDTSDLTVDSVFEQVIDFIKSKQKTVGTNQQAND